MKRINTNNTLFEVKIEENLEKLYKQRVYLHQGHKKAIAKNTSKANHKWNIIKRHIGNQINSQNRKQAEIKKTKGKPLAKDKLLEIINRSLALQQTIMELAQTVGHYRCLPMFFIFFQSGLNIVFNAYNLVVYLLKVFYAGHSADTALSITMMFIFHGFHIMSAFMETLVSVIAYHGVYEMLRNAGTIMDEWNIFITGDDVKLRLSHFSSYVYNNLRTFNIYGLYNIDGSLILSFISVTTTYIIILIQYSGDGEICKNPLSQNNTSRQ